MIPRMALSLPDHFAIFDSDETNLPCCFCDVRGVADPDDLAKWAEHLATVHGYRVASDEPRAGGSPRTIRLTLASWSPRAKFQPNQRVTVGENARGDYREQRGTVVGWHARDSEYCVRFDQEPVIGWLASDWLEAFVKTPQPTK
jgi:hypothetical protein